MMRSMTILWGVLAIACGIGLFLVKHQVQATEADLRQMQHQVRSDRSTIRVLEAEWTYLNDPARLSALSERVLGLVPLRPQQVVAMASLPVRPDAAPTQYFGGEINLGQNGLPWATYPHRKPIAELASARTTP
ncbi:MAG: hypothetical protein WCZ23_05760 [Rhodospirillaceae bacterium]